MNAPGAAVAVAGTRSFDLRRLAFTWQVRGEVPDLHSAAVLAAAERHLQSRRARVERAADGQGLSFESGSGARRNWLGAIGGGRLQVSEIDGRVDLTVSAGVTRTLLICALPAVLICVLGAWPLALLFAFAGAANLWFVDRGARHLMAAALERRGR